MGVQDSLHVVHGTPQSRPLLHGVVNGHGQLRREPQPFLVEGEVYRYVHDTWDLRWGQLVLLPTTGDDRRWLFSRAASTGLRPSPSCWATVVLEAWGAPPYMGESEPFFMDSV